ncbi:MAG: sulfatase-like hydrolase/transferase [Opitutaceae bacterium]|nr:sulfatase-like hydrolase/transferase [Opitutaceae bacterium]
MRALFRLLFLLTAILAYAGSKAAERPNIIFILTDDLGYGDLGCFGQKRFRTPALDRMSAEGARLTNHYAAAPVCAPARASLLLGVHQGHANVRDNQFDKALEDNHTLATVLRRAGYATAAIGKWGLHGQPVGGGPTGADPNTPAHPLNRGFDHFYGVLRHIDGHEHYPKEAPYFAAKAKARGPVFVWEDRTNVTPGLDRCYTTDLFTARAKRFITEHNATTPAQPFFLYLAYDTPHAVLELPTQAYPEGGGLKGGLQWLGKPGHMINTASGTIDSWTNPEFLPASTGQPWGNVYQRQATSVRRIDDAVGDLLQLLADLRIDSNTLVVFTSDNGPETESMLPEPFTPEFFRSYGPFDGIKRDLWEGGTRVPTLVRWPAHIPAGQVISEPSAQWDWLPTFATLAGLPPPARADGISLLPALAGGRASQVPRPLYFEYFVNGVTPSYPDFDPSHRGRRRNQMQAVRLGDLVGVRYDVKSPDAPFEIYNVVTDPKEATNLADQPGNAGMQSRLRAISLQSRRPDATAPRPYDRELMPAIELATSSVGLHWQACIGRFPWVPDFATLSPTATGRTAQPDLNLAEMADASGVLFTGYLEVPADGDYVFQLDTSTRASLRLHDALVIDCDFGYRPGTAVTRSVRLAAGLHPVRLSCLRKPSGISQLDLEWSGPGFAMHRIPNSAWRAQ